MAGGFFQWLAHRLAAGPFVGGLGPLGFYRCTTRTFSLKLKLAGVTQDISGDTVTFRMKRRRSDDDSAAVLSKVADVASEGASGVATFTLSVSELDVWDTDIEPGSYYADIEWVRAGGDEYVVYDGVVEVEERVSDI